MSTEQSRELATLAGGCFWCLEAVYKDLRGVERVVSGYAGGDVPRPTYQQVCEGTTGHAEVVQITFDPREVSFRELLEVFFTVHDPGRDAPYTEAFITFTERYEAAATIDSRMDQIWHK